MKTTPNGTPTFGSRFVGYVGLTMYETVVHSNPKYHSLSGKLNGLDYLPSPSSSKIKWKLALNAGQAQIIKSIYDFTSEANLKRIDSLEQHYLTIESKGYSQRHRSLSRIREEYRQCYFRMVQNRRWPSRLFKKF